MAVRVEGVRRERRNTMGLIVSGDGGVQLFVKRIRSELVTFKHKFNQE